MLDPINELVGRLLAFFYALVPSLGVAIILLTFTVMLLLFPLTAKQARAQLAMQDLQPEIKKMQAKHKGDRQKVQEETMKLYQERGVNPLGGCLPLLIQMPVFFSLFQVLRTTYRYVPTDSALFDELCSPYRTSGDCNDAANYPLHAEFLGLDLSVTPLNAEGGLFSVLPYFVLVGLVVATGFMQSRQTRRTTPAGANPQMLKLMTVLPVAFGLFSLNFPAGLVLYFLVSNVWRLGQQEVIFRRIHLPHRHAKGEGPPPKPTKGTKDTKETKETKDTKNTKNTKNTKASKQAETGAGRNTKTGVARKAGPPAGSGAKSLTKKTGAAPPAPGSAERSGNDKSGAERVGKGKVSSGSGGATAETARPGGAAAAGSRTNQGRKRRTGSNKKRKR